MSCVELLAPVTKCVQLAGKLLAAEWKRSGGPRGSGDKASVDTEIEVLLRKSLLELLGCDFWGEETGYHLSGHEYCWVVDPNDGTRDFLLGRQGSAISVGLLRGSRPVLGVVYAPITVDRGPDCIAWAEGCSRVIRNGEEVLSGLQRGPLTSGSQVLMSTAAGSKADLNAELCSPANCCPMPSIAYRLARVAVGDAIAGASLVSVGAHDVVAGHALLTGANGVLLNQDGLPVAYHSVAQMMSVSRRCFGGAPEVCRELANRDWQRLF
ncbi:TPA: inositol monophosphatase [Pseudomonas aeruginosa]